MNYTLSSSGSHTFSVKAQSGPATSAAASYTWTVTTPAPSIVSEPSNPVASSSARFTYSDSQVGVSFRCSLDSSSFSPCSSSAVTYNGLRDGTHSFSVEAQLGSGPVSPVTSYTWRVDTAPPTVNMSFPRNLGYYNSTSWAAGCSPAGICGTASDPSGVASIAVGMLQWSSGEYWNGSSFSSRSMVFNTASGTTSWHYPLGLPPGGIYTVFVKATDSLGNATSGGNLIEATFYVTSGKASAIAVSSGSPQSATVHSAFGSPFVAKVTDYQGNSVSGATVAFTAPTSSASGSFASCSGGNPSANECLVTTNSSGFATSSTFTANTIAGGPYTVAATTSGVSGTASFSLTNNPGLASQLVFTSAAVSGPASSSATLGPLTVQVEDAYGNVVKVGSNTIIGLTSSSIGGIFATTSGGSATGSVTIPSGSSTASFYYDDSHAGSPKITASSGSLSAGTQIESISKASPTVIATGPASDTTGTAIASSSISSAFAGSSGTNSSGTITVKVFGPQSSAPTSCATGGTTVGTSSVSGNGTYHPSSGYTPTAAGSYFWYASYNGDSNNSSAVSTCGSGMSVTVSGSTGSKLVITTSPVSGAASNSAGLGPITVQVQNSSGTPVNVTSATTVNLSSSSTGGVFATSPGGTGVTSVTIASGSSSTSLYYGDTKAGTPTITATSTPLTAANQTETITAGAAKSIAVSSGSGQSATVNTNFTNPLVAIVTDAYSNPVSGVTVSFTAPASGASASFAGGLNTAVTNSSGLATSATFTANTVAGGPNISATGSGLNTVNFSETNNAGAAAAAFITPSPSSATASSTTNIKLSFQLVDLYGNATTSVGTTTLTLSTTSSKGFFATSNGSTGTLSGTFNVAFANGVGTAIEYYGDETAPASPTITAKNAGTVWAITSVTINTGSASAISVVSGSGQSATVNKKFASPLVALVTDSFNNPVPGVSVVFTAPASGISGTFGSTNTITVGTGTDGQASSGTLTANTAAGPYSVSATGSGLNTVNFPETNSAGVATKAVITPSPSQATASNKTNILLSLQLEDQYGNQTTSVGTTTLTLSASSTGGFFASSTGASGTLGGTLNVTFADGVGTSTAYYGDENAATPVITATNVSTVFGTTTVTITAGDAKTITVFNGAGQSATVNTAFTNPLTAVVTDAYSNAVSGVTVSFTAPGSGASGSFAGGVNTAVTNSSGLATSATFTANTVAGGPYNVSATGSGLDTVNFSETNNAGAPKTVSIVSGSPQSATQGTAFTDPLVVVVHDTYGNPVPGASVIFTAPSAGASETFSNASNSITIATDVNGQVSSGAFTANYTGGTYTVEASSGSASSADFSLLNGMNFSISGTIPSGQPLFPGQNDPIDVSIYNPNPEAITIASGGITVSISGAPPGCPSGSFAMTKGLTAGVVVPAGTTMSLSDLGVSSSDWPIVSMIETGTNQDACQGATLTLTWAGTGSGS